MKESIYVFQDWVSRELASRTGIEPIARPDLKDKSRMIYIFPKTDEVEREFKSIIKDK